MLPDEYLYAAAGGALIGLASVLGGFIHQAVTGNNLIERTDFPVWMTVVAGLLVGYGTRMGGGCTSGHGICGLGRLSKRSVVATLTFVVVGITVATTLSKVMG